MYELRHLRSLCAIAEHGSVTAAAAALDFTQPAVSQHLAALEAEVGTQLVTRSRGGARLTEAGALLLEHARAAFDRLAVAEVQMRDLVDREERRVHVATHSSSLVALIPTAVADLLRAMPDADVTLREQGPPAALAALRAGDVDVAVYFRRPGAEAPSDLAERVLLEEPMYVALPHSHPLAAEEEVELADLADDPWVQAPASSSPGLIRELCREAGFRPRIAFESDDPLASRGMVATGLAVTLVPGLTKDDTARDTHVAVRRLRDAPVRQVLAGTVAGGRVSPATAAMVDALVRAGRRASRSIASSARPRARAAAPGGGSPRGR